MSEGSEKTGNGKRSEMKYIDGVKALVEFAWKKHDVQRVNGERRDFIDMRVGYYVNVALDQAKVPDTALTTRLQPHIDKISDELKVNFNEIITTKIREDFTERLTREIKEYVERRIADSLKFSQICLVASLILVIIVIGVGIAAIGGWLG